VVTRSLDRDVSHVASDAILQSIITPDITGPSEWHASVRSPTRGTADNAWQNLDSDRVVSANARI
jgi:hypothetical protein